MEFRSDNNELKLAGIMFKNIFSNIKILRYDSTTQQEKLDLVKCVFGQRSRILKNLQNPTKDGVYSLPLIVINRTGYSRQSTRHNNPNNEVKYEMTSKNRSYDLLTPVPIDISYDVFIMAKNPDDIDQIATNFMVFINPDKYVSQMHPKYEGVKLNNQIVMDDSVSEDHPDELDPTTDDIITTTFHFTFKTYLFGGVVQAKRVPVKVLSSYTKTELSNVVVNLSPDEIDIFRKNNPNTSLSTTIQQEITHNVTAWVDNPNLSNMVYDGFIPIINSIHMEYYDVPIAVSDYQTYTTSVDNSQYPNIFKDTLIWTIDSATETTDI